MYELLNSSVARSTANHRKPKSWTWIFSQVSASSDQAATVASVHTDVSVNTWKNLSSRIQRRLILEGSKGVNSNSVPARIADGFAPNT